MSPTMKKILLIGGAAVVGYVVYSRFAKKPVAPTAKLQLAQLSRVAMLSKAPMTFAKVAAPVKTAGWY